MSARIWTSPDVHEESPDDRRPTLRLNLDAWRKRVQRMDARSGGLRSSGLFAIRVDASSTGGSR